MDPYLERPYRWLSMHPQLVSALPDLIAPLLPERYVISVEERVYLMVPGAPARMRVPDAMILDQGGTRGAAGGVATLPEAVDITIPLDDPVRELFIEIRDLMSQDEVVTVIEVLSPTNKLDPGGRDEYVMKRGMILSTQTSLVEIDLLRSGTRMSMFGAPKDYDYGITISRAWMRPRGTLLPFTIRDPIPPFPVPLREGEMEPMVDIAPALAKIYASNSLDRRIDYGQEPEPPLAPHDAAWVDSLLRENGLR